VSGSSPNRCRTCWRKGHTARAHAGLTNAELEVVKQDGREYMARGFRELGEPAPDGDLLDQLRADTEAAELGALRLSATDPEPGPGSRVRDRHDRMWQNTQDYDHPGGANWQRSDDDGRTYLPDVATWVRVNEAGPVVALELFPMANDGLDVVASPEVPNEEDDDPAEAEPLVWDRTEHDCEPAPDQVMFCRHCGADLMTVELDNRSGRFLPYGEQGPQFAPWRTPLGPDGPKLITLPGVYQLTAEEYHSFAVTGDWFSNSDAKKLLTSCPAQFDYDRRHGVRKTSDAFDFGHVAHAIVLGQGERFEVFEPCKLDGRTKEGKAQKRDVDAARAAGRTPIYGDQFAVIAAMAEAIKADPLPHELLTQPGRPEVCLFWVEHVRVTDPKNSLYGTVVEVKRRAMIDHLPDMLDDGTTVRLVDYKTADEVKPDDNMRKKNYDYGYHRQASTYESAILTLFGRYAEVTFLMQSKRPPHLIVPMQMDTPAMLVAAAQNHEAMQQWAECVAAGVWPGHVAPNTVATSGVPAWIERQYEEEIEVG